MAYNPDFDSACVNLRSAIADIERLRSTRSKKLAWIQTGIDDYYHELKAYGKRRGWS